MERLITHEVDKKRDGTRIVRNYFINTDNTNYMTLAHSHFTKAQRTIAKNKSKNN